MNKKSAPTLAENRNQSVKRQ